MFLSTALAAFGFAGFSALRVLHVPAAVALQRAEAASAPNAGSGKTPIEKIHITFQTVPPVKAEIKWGKKSLGLITSPRKPLIVDRPRDSGPLDVVVTAEGFLPVHTRAYTFSDSKVFVKLTPVTEKHTLFGYRAEIPDGGADGGVAGGGGPDGGAPVMAPGGTLPGAPMVPVPSAPAPSPAR